MARLKGGSHVAGTLSVEGIVTVGGLQIDETQTLIFSGVPALTANYIPKSGSANTIVNSSITDNGSLVTVNNPLSVTGAVSLSSTINALTLAAQADGFTIAGGTASRTLTVTGANKTFTGTATTLTLNQAITLAGDAARTLTINNANKTIAGAATVLTFGGNFTHTGAHTLTLTTSAATSITLPTTGTLSTTTHIHGSITAAGAITANVTTATGDRIIIADSSDSSLLKGGAAFGAGTTTFLRNDGTWATPDGTFSHAIKTWVDKSNLTGAVVISNLTIDATGHPTNWTTRSLTAADLSAVATSGDQTITGIKTFSTQIRIPTSLPTSLAEGAIWLE